MKRILMCFGTRPEAIKMAPLYYALQNEGLNIQICVTAQHRSMLDQVLEFFQIQPDFDLDLMRDNQSLNLLCSSILASFEHVLNELKPDLLLVHGDTSTSTMAALAAFQKRIKIGHVEAGLRTYNKDAPFPEEMNRQLTGKLATYHFAPTDQAAQNLINENVKSENIVITGNTVVDSLMWTNTRLKTDYVNDEINKLKFLESRKIVLVTGHRRENFGQGLINICHALLRIVEQTDAVVVFPVHLNPNVQDAVNNILGANDDIYLIDPVSYPTMVYLMRNCSLIISDSGGIQEEAPAFAKHVLVTREISERPEGLAAGFSTLVGTDPDRIYETAIQHLSHPVENRMKNPYGDGNASEKIVAFIKSKLAE